MGGLNFWTATRLCALTGLIVTFPPVFAHIDRSDGLKLALAVFLIYLLRGLARLVVDTGTTIAINHGKKEGRRVSSQTIVFAQRAVLIERASPLSP